MEISANEERVIFKIPVNGIVLFTSIPFRQTP